MQLTSQLPVIGTFLALIRGNRAGVSRSRARELPKMEDQAMAKATLNDGQELLAVNDFFIGQRTHQSARYQIEIAGQSERHSSSGVIISTPLGSTGWLKSLLHGATRIAGIATGHESPAVDHSVPWSTQHLYFTVREPFPSRATQADLVFGKVSKKHPLTIRSQMPENGVLFSDGIEQDFIDFNSGASATITLANTSGNVVVAG